MAKPIVEFTQEPPLRLDNLEAKEVTLSVRPGAEGDCAVTLSIFLPDCCFENGEHQVTQTITALNEEDRLDCTFLVKMLSDSPDTYFTLLFAQAVNAAQEKSYRKPIELEIDCQPTELPA